MSRFIQPSQNKVKTIIQSSIDYFERALKINSKDQRIHLGLAQGYTVQATKTSFYHAKTKRHKIGDKANHHYEKAVYRNEKLSKMELHSNAIAYFGKAINTRNNIRDDYKALKACEQGLKHEPENTKLLELKEQLEYKITPTSEQMKKAFEKKGWLK